MRVAARYQVPARSLLRALDPGVRQFRSADAVRLTDDLAEVIRAGVHRGCTPMDGVVRAWAARFGRRLAPHGGASFCPSCLAEPVAYWRQRWAHPLTVLCAQHRCLLVQRCPGCERRAHVSLSGTSEQLPVWMCPSQLNEPYRAARSRRQWCRTDLREAVTEGVTSEQVEAVERAYDAIEAAAGADGAPWTMPVRGWAITRGEFADALLELVDEQVPAAAWGRTNRRVLMGAIVVADAIVHAPSTTSLAALCDQHGVLDPAGSRTPLTGANDRRRPRSELLMSLRLESIGPHLSLSRRLTYRIASSHPRDPLVVDAEQPAGGMGVWPARGWVPPVLWASVLDEPAMGSGDHLRAGLSVALSKVGSHVPLRVVAVDLGLPGWLADRLGAIFRGADLDALTAGVEALFVRLAQSPPPIDYAGRVVVGRERAVFEAATGASLQAQDIRVDETAQHDAAVSLWATFTGSLPCYCPWARPGAHAGLPWFVEQGEFMARAFVALPHPRGEPLVWTPP